MGQDEKGEMDHNSDQRLLAMNRRAVLRGAVAAGATGALAGCLGSFEREYEATPGIVPEETAREHNLKPDPKVQKRSETITQGLGVTNLEAEVTGYTTTYEADLQETDTEQPTEEPTTPPSSSSTPTDTPTPTQTPEPTPTPTTAPEDDEEADDEQSKQSTAPTSTRTRTPTGAPSAEVVISDQQIRETDDGLAVTVGGAFLENGGYIVLRTEGRDGPIAGTSDYIQQGESISNLDIRLEGALTSPTMVSAVPHRRSDGEIGTPYTKNGQPVSDTARLTLGQLGAVESDTLNISSTPNANFVGQNLNPIATKSIEKLIEEETQAFERACNCTIEKPGQVEVQSVDPTETTISKDDIGKTVYHLDKESEILSDVPKSTELLGNEKPIELFLIPSSGEKEDVVKADLVATTKTKGQLQSGTQEAVVASYISTTSTLSELGIHLIESDAESTSSTLSPTPTAIPTPTPDSETTSGGMYSPDEVENAAGQLDGVCPDITNGSAETTTTPTQTRTPTPSFPMDELVRLAEQVRDSRNELIRQFNELKRAQGTYSSQVLAALREGAQLDLSEENISKPERKSLRQRVESINDLGEHSVAASFNAEIYANSVERIEGWRETIPETRKEYEKFVKRMKEFMQKWNWKKGMDLLEKYTNGEIGYSEFMQRLLESELPPGLKVEPLPKEPRDNPEWSCECVEADAWLNARYNPPIYGHAWIEIHRRYRCTHSATGTVHTKTIIRNYGFYPAPGTINQPGVENVWERLKATGATVKGLVKLEPKTRGKFAPDCSKHINVSCDIAERLNTNLQNRRAPPKQSANYSIPDYNCVDWAIHQLVRTGATTKTNLPPREGGGIDTPPQLCLWIKAN